MANETNAAVQAPQSINDILEDIKGFGIEDFEDVIVLQCGSKAIQLKISNIPTEQERIALLAVEEFKGYNWLQEIKCEIISRAISWINGVDLRKLPTTERRVLDPEDHMEKDIQVVLRNLIKGWGQEYMQVLWKVLMVHSQNIENRLLESFPEASQMTEAERRYTELASKEIEEQSREVIQDQLSQLFPDEDTPPNAA